MAWYLTWYLHTHVFMCVRTHAHGSAHPLHKREQNTHTYTRPIVQVYTLTRKRIHLLAVLSVLCV